MCDFDIASFRDRSFSLKKKKKSKTDNSKKRRVNAFADYLEKRKTLGLDASDSEESGNENENENKNENKNENEKEHRNEDEEEEEKRAKKRKKSLTDTALMEQNTLQNDPVDNDLDLVEIDPFPTVTLKNTLTRKSVKRHSLLHNLVDLSAEDPLDIILDTSLHHFSATPIHLPHYRSRQMPPQQEPDLILLPSAPISSTVDIEELDPELALIVQNSSQSTHSPSTPTSVGENTSEPYSKDPPKVHIKVQFVCVSRPQELQAQTALTILEKPVGFVVLENDPFDKLLTHFCKHKCLLMKDVILTHKNVHVFLRATPASLEMSLDQVNTMGKCWWGWVHWLTLEYEKKVKQEEETKAEMFRKMNRTAGEELLEEYQQADSSAETDTAQRLCLTLRDKDNVDTHLRVKKTTTIKAILQQYIRIHRLDSGMESRLRLSFEEETLSPDLTVQETELEDEDMISVCM
ncbi:hypothetical protein BDF14DRAFT_1881036 [Spinellus fusiger]|nr:hypothetical protein BDF14DRAFT_1881036 [Spinellus fusiger]